MENGDDDDGNYKEELSMYFLFFIIVIIPRHEDLLDGWLILLEIYGRFTSLDDLFPPIDDDDDDDDSDDDDNDDDSYDLPESKTLFNRQLIGSTVLPIKIENLTSSSAYKIPKLTGILKG